MHVERPQHDRPGFDQPLHHGAIPSRYPVPIHQRTGGVRHPGDSEQIFHRDWNALERPAVEAGGQFGVGAAGIG